MAVKPIPDGYQTVIPYMVVDQPVEVIRFLENVFQGKETSRHTTPEGNVMHAEVKIGDSVIMLGQSGEKHAATKSMIYIYTQNTDEAYQRALTGGATSLMEPANQFYGDRNAEVVDPWGNTWWISTHVEDVSEEEMKKRSEKFAQEQG